jgi:tetratricopeptide (TPR) repeat protein
MSAGISLQQWADSISRRWACLRSLWFEITLVCALALERHDSPLIGDSWSRIGLLFIDMGKYYQALEMHAKSLEIMTHIYGNSHLDVAASYSNMGDTNEEEALEMYSKSLEIDIRVHGDSHLDVARSFNNIGLMYEKGDLEPALSHLQKSQDIKIRVLGHENLLVADTWNNIGVVYLKKGNRAAATEMYIKAYNIYLKMLGPDHPKTQGLKPFVNAKRNVNLCNVTVRQRAPGRGGVEGKHRSSL